MRTDAQSRAKVPVSVKEYLTLLDAIGAPVDDFYDLASTTLVGGESAVELVEQRLILESRKAQPA